MQYPIIVKTTANNYYEAEPMGIPELRITAATEEDAIEKATQVLGQWFTSARVVQVDIQGNDTSNPWLKACGRSSNDPDFDDFIAEMDHARRENES